MQENSQASETSELTAEPPTLEELTTETILLTEAQKRCGMQECQYCSKKMVYKYVDRF